MAELDQAFRANPSDVAVLAELANLELTAGDHRKAKRLYRALLLQKLEPGGPITKAEVYMGLHDVHLRLGDRKRAQIMLERAVEADPQHARAADLLAQERERVRERARAHASQVRAGSVAHRFSDGKAEGVGVTPEERFFRLPVVRAFMFLVPGVVLAVLARECLSHSAEARMQTEILACGKPGCAVRRHGGQAFGKDADYVVVYRRETPEGSSLWRAVFSCPRRYWLFGEHQCQRVSDFPTDL